MKAILEQLWEYRARGWLTSQQYRTARGMVINSPDPEAVRILLYNTKWKTRTIEYTP